MVDLDVQISFLLKANQYLLCTPCQKSEHGKIDPRQRDLNKVHINKIKLTFSLTIEEYYDDRRLPIFPLSFWINPDRSDLPLRVAIHETELPGCA